MYGQAAASYSAGALGGRQYARLLWRHDDGCNGGVKACLPGRRRELAAVPSGCRVLRALVHVHAALAPAPGLCPPALPHILCSGPCLQRLALSFLIYFLLLRLSNMRLWRGRQALDADVGAPALPLTHPLTQLHACLPLRLPAGGKPMLGPAGLAVSAGRRLPRWRVLSRPCFLPILLVPLPTLQPDHMLLVDRPMADKLRSHLLILLLWMITCAFIAVTLAGRVSAC